MDGAGEGEGMKNPLPAGAKTIEQGEEVAALVVPAAVTALGMPDSPGTLAVRFRGRIHGSGRGTGAARQRQE
jgi:hypothetical protein